MSRSKGSPRVTVEITETERQTAVDSNSGGCLIADALKRAGWSSPTVDMATIRFSDPKAGLRYTYLTPQSAQYLLLGFDQGWSQQGTSEIKIERAVKITPIIKAPIDVNRRAARLNELEVKEAEGTMTSDDRRSLARMRKTPTRPSTRGPAKVNSRGVVTGGAPLVQGPAHPNLLRGRNRIFGAKLADPGKAFNEAVEKAIAERDAQAAALALTPDTEE